MVELPDVGDKMPAELSGGMKKRVALARAVSLRPRYILYDEPTSGLDPETSNTIDVLIKGLADQLNVTSIVITHDMHSVLNIADRAAFIYKGRMHWVGTLEELHRSDDRTLGDFVRANEYQIGGANGRSPAGSHAGPELSARERVEPADDAGPALSERKSAEPADDGMTKPENT
jgi:phospholipid/cholesterol/gamma-HCH transport system ATP-binding protein